MAKPVQLQTYSWHRKELIFTEGSCVIQRSGTGPARPRCARHRFRDTLLHPYIKMAALGEGKVSQETLEELERRSPVLSVGVSSEWPSELQQPVEQSRDVPRD